MIVAFFQNQWARDPESLQRVMDRHLFEPERHADLVRRMMAVGNGKTWQVLKQTFGDDILAMDEFVFENVSTKVGGESSSKFEPDLAHVRRVLDHFKPEAVVIFGKVAAKAVYQAWTGTTFEAPHPAARGKDVVAQLQTIADLVRARLKPKPTGDAA